MINLKEYKVILMWELLISFSYFHDGFMFFKMMVPSLDLMKYLHLLHLNIY